MLSKVIPEDIALVQTCEACPEQYDAFIDGQQVGYLRLRHGGFTVYSPDYPGSLVLSASPSGDGIFDGEEERSLYLDLAKKAICMELNRLSDPVAYERDIKGWKKAVAEDKTFLSLTQWIEQS